MADTERRFSELSVAATLTDNDILALSQTDIGTSTLISVRATLIAIATHIAKVAAFTNDLDTTNKTLIGAINELKQLISLIPQFSIDVVQTLPVSDISETTIYLVPNSDPEQGNYYNEYIYINNTWELVGTTAVDLSAYYTKLEVDGLLAAKANTSDVTAALALKEAKSDMNDDVTDIIVALTDTQTATGNPVTLTTVQEGGAKSALVTFAPKQDLHGQSAPYPEGGGKNKLLTTVSRIKNWNTNGTWSGNVYTVNDGTFTIKTDTDGNVIGIIVNGTFNAQTSFIIEYRNNESCPYNGYVLNGCPSGGGGSTYDFGVSDITTGSSKDYGSGVIISLANTGKWNCSIVIRNGYTATNLLFTPMISQNGGDFAPYSNICPISGRDSLSLNVAKKNLFDEANTTIYNGTLTSDGHFNSSESARCYIFEAIKTKEYAISFIDDTDLILKRIATIDELPSSPTGEFSISTYQRNQSMTSPYTITPTHKYIVIQFTADFINNRNSNLQIEYGSTATTYEPYQGQTHTATFPSIVMGGSYDFVSGKLIIDKALIDLGSLTWSMTSTSGCFRTHGLDSLAELGTTGQVDAIATIYKNNPTARDVESLADYSFCVGGSQSSYKLFLKDTRYTSASDFETAISGQKICYKLATPTEITLTPETIALLKGANVLWTDGDTVQIKYSELPQGNLGAVIDYIQKLEARIKALES